VRKIIPGIILRNILPSGGQSFVPTTGDPWTKPKNNTRYYFQGYFAKWRAIIVTECRQSLDEGTGQKDTEHVSMDTIDLIEVD